MMEDFNRDIIDLEKKDNMMFQFSREVNCNEWEKVNDEIESENEYE